MTSRTPNDDSSFTAPQREEKTPFQEAKPPHYIHALARVSMTLTWSLRCPYRALIHLLSAAARIPVMRTLIRAAVPPATANRAGRPLLMNCDAILLGSAAVLVKFCVRVEGGPIAHVVERAECNCMLCRCSVSPAWSGRRGDSGHT